MRREEGGGGAAKRSAGEWALSAGAALASEEENKLGIITAGLGKSCRFVEL
jgi:hypothetical protein